MHLIPVLPSLALLLCGCAATPKPPTPIPAVAQARVCPGYPLPPPGLLKPPARTDFLSLKSAPAQTEGLLVLRTR